MANQKSKKTTKKSSAKSDAKTTKKETISAASSAGQEHPFKGFFARKCDSNENVLTIFKSKRIWGALLGELIGTMLLSMLLLTLGVQSLYFVFVAISIYVVIVGLSGANLNPLVTAGMMATRRMSAIRGVLYMLAQVLGAWIGLIIINAFRLGSQTMTELPVMGEVTGEVFWSVALVELLGAMVIAFCFARSLKYARRSPLTFAFTVTSGITLAIVFGAIISQNYFAYSDTTFMFNPAVALMYQILPTTAEDGGDLFAKISLALSTYVLVPVIGGIIGFYISDVSTRLADGGYYCDDSLGCDNHKKHHLLSEASSDTQEEEE